MYFVLNKTLCNLYKGEINLTIVIVFMLKNISAKKNCLFKFRKYLKTKLKLLAADGKKINTDMLDSENIIEIPKSFTDNKNIIIHIIY